MWARFLVLGLVFCGTIGSVIKSLEDGHLP